MRKLKVRQLQDKNIQFKNNFYLSLVFHHCSMKETLYTLYAFCFVIVFFWVISLTIQSNTISHAGPGKHFFTAIAPQGWGFFTRSPKDDNVDVYVVNKGDLSLLSYPNASYKNYLGCSRKSRTIGMEISIVMEKLKNVSWDTVIVDRPQLQIPMMVHHVNPKFLNYLSKGEYLLVKKPITPWAWYGNKYNFIPYETIHVQID